MKISERDLIEQAAKNSMQLKRLFDKHKSYEELLISFKNRSYLSEDEQAEEKKIKLMKLRGKDQMLSILAQSNFVTSINSPN